VSRIRGFEKIEAFKGDAFPLPKRKTNASAGYDIATQETMVLPPKKSAIIPTGLKAYMPPREVLMVFARSSLYKTKHLMLTNHVAVIDSDYYDNSDNEGHIMISVLNVSDHDVTIKRGERLFQGIFMSYLVIDDDREVLPKRNGGFGSTGTSDS